MRVKFLVIPYCLVLLEQGGCMVVELAAHAYEGVLPLSADLTYHLSISAVLRGTMPGHVLVDSERFPARCW